MSAMSAMSANWGVKRGCWVQPMHRVARKHVGIVPESRFDPNECCKNAKSEVKFFFVMYA